jgi:hypothetical protein
MIRFILLFLLSTNLLADDLIREGPLGLELNGERIRSNSLNQYEIGGKTYRKDALGNYTDGTTTYRRDELRRWSDGNTTVRKTPLGYRIENNAKNERLHE